MSYTPGVPTIRTMLVLSPPNQVVATLHSDEDTGTPRGPVSGTVGVCPWPMHALLT